MGGPRAHQLARSAYLLFLIMVYFVGIQHALHLNTHPLCAQSVYCVAYRFNQCKSLIAGRLPEWLEAWFELEALNSLANFAYLNPDYVQPNIHEELATPPETPHVPCKGPHYYDSREPETHKGPHYY